MHHTTSKRNHTHSILNVFTMTKSRGLRPKQILRQPFNLDRLLPLDHTHASESYTKVVYKNKKPMSQQLKVGQ